MTKDRLTSDDWLAAGFRALASAGPNALRAEALARTLNTTKGSFYWHFADLPAYKTAMLGLWRTKVATEIFANVMAAPSGWPRLDMLAAEAARPAPDDFGGPGIESAIRAWALADAEVAQALSEVDQLRVAFIAELIRDVNLDGARLAPVVYAAYIGLDDLSSKGRADLQAGMEALLAVMRPS